MVPSPPIDRVRLKCFESSNDRGHLSIPNNVYTPEANRLSYFDNNTIKDRVQRKMICLQTDQSKVMGFFNVIVRLNLLQ